MSTELDHLLDRAERNVLLPGEGDRLRELVGKVRGNVEFYEAATARMRNRAEVATVRADRAKARVRELEAEVARLTAGQCLDSRAMCEKHHAPPVDGCPYPRCKAARNRDQRAPVAPAEHCGDQPPTVDGLHNASPTECVLRPGHQGSHADQHGMRWWLATEQPTTEA
ncbi:hypothetical protein [Streptomyces sp. rh34]|uniref:hypothetical protein n=1 Tax=Streptomyces sp. rh34 TaxID=2034272 RepID=UPI000BF1219C|nr:hypothetical protein [Streptomyces sp. rh34]